MKASNSKTRKPSARQSKHRLADYNTFRRLRAQPAPLANDFLIAVERDLAPTSATSISRRVALGLMTLSGRRLIESAKGDREMAEALAEGHIRAAAAATKFRALADIFEASSVRALVALCVRKDVLEILYAARSDQESGRNLCLSNAPSPPNE